MDDINSIIKKEELATNLDIIHTGPVPPNPSELLLSDRLEALIEELKKRYDYIILDNVPAGLVADAAIVNRVADLTIYILRAGYKWSQPYYIIWHPFWQWVYFCTLF